MMVRSAVVSGASIAGLSAAYWLSSTGWKVTVLERADAFRDGGQNVDLRGASREVLDLMGLTSAVRAATTTETGTAFLTDDGSVIGEFATDETVEGPTAELEVLRGDLARIMLEALPADVDVVFADTITAVDRAHPGTSPAAGPVEVTTASGRTWSSDLLVICEGVRSATRDLVFGAEAQLKDLGINMVFATIPRRADDDGRWRWYTTTRGRQVHLRPDNHGTTRALLSYRDAHGEDLVVADRNEALAKLRCRYRDVSLHAPRILESLAAADDVYIDHLTQVRMPTWSQGNTVIAGDAAWCVTPLGGGGAALALTSGYVLAAYLSTHPDDIQAALHEYERWMRPLVDDVQKLPPGLIRMAYPSSRLGITAQRLGIRALTSRPLRPLLARTSQVARTATALPRLAT